MAIFSYQAKNAKGRTVRGQSLADTPESLAAHLRTLDLTLIKAKTVTANQGGINGWFERLLGVPVVQKIFFTQNLGVMLRGGFSIGRALGIMALQTTHGLFKKILLTLQQDVEGGTQFAAALGKYPTVFSEMFVNMIAAGEVSGKLDDVLHHLTIQMKKEHALLSKVKGALTYPIIVVIGMIGAGAAMIIFVVPKLTSVFSENSVELPLATRILIAISDALAHQGILIAVVTIALVAGLLWFGRTTRGRRIYDLIWLSTPVAGTIIKKINLARFTRSLSSLLSTDIPIIQTFQIIAKTLSSVHYRQSIEESAQALKTGTAIAKVLERYPRLYPPLVQQMVNVGEESGTLESVSNELALFYEDEVDQTMANLSTIIEPVMLIILGVAVAFMAVAIMMPMYNLTEAIN